MKGRSSFLCCGLFLMVPNYAERFIGDVDGFLNVLIGQGRIDEVVVVVCKEHATLDTFGNPLLVQVQRRIVGKAQVRQGFNTRHMQVKAIVGSGFEQTAF